MQVEAGWRSWPGGMQVDWSGWLRTPRRAQAPFAGVPRCLLLPFDIRSMAPFNRDISKYQATMHPRRRMPRWQRLARSLAHGRPDIFARIERFKRPRGHEESYEYIYICRGAGNLFLRGWSWRLIDSFGWEFGWMDN